MDAASLREKAALCLRISRGLSWNNPARLQLLELAERLERQAKEFELQNHPAEKVSRAACPQTIIIFDGKGGGKRRDGIGAERLLPTAFDPPSRPSRTTCLAG
jgi:hypothetical protein